MKKIVIISFLLCILLVGCASDDISQSNLPHISETELSTSPLSSSPNVVLTLVRNEDDSESLSLSEDELQSIYNGSINFPSYLNVLIDINGESIPIRDAILEKRISVEEFIAGIRTDARNGYCTESYESELGLTYFLYTYRNFEVAIFDDVWEAPNGEAFLVRDIYINKKGGFNSESIARFYTNEDGEEISYKREDWGLEFETQSITPTGLVVRITQSDGQQLGQLQMDNIYTAVICSSGFLKENGDFSMSPSDGLIEMNGSSEIAFDWSACLGELPSGDYALSFRVKDVYDPNNIHPFTKNYTDLQIYSIQFEIP